MKKQTKHTYDDIPYLTSFDWKTHPDNLATIAKLSGMSPPSVSRCRVLELCCGNGANIISMAHSLPDSMFVGIDQSAGAIAEGCSIAEGLRLKNVELRELNVFDFPDDIGRFDYIIINGAFTWFTTEGQDDILRLIKNHLNENGVASIKYTTKPGGVIPMMMRDMMMYQVRDIEDPRQKMKEARSYLSSLADNVKSDSPFAAVYSAMLRYGADEINKASDDVLFHGLLGAVVTPLTFAEFIEQAKTCGLGFLSEANITMMAANVFSHEILDALRESGKSEIDIEQHFDFQCNRSVRETLLCHQENTVSHQLSYEDMAEFFVSSAIRPVTPEVNIFASGKMEFSTPDGRSVVTESTVSKAVLLCLGSCWPQSLSFDSLLLNVRKVLGVKGNGTLAQDSMVVGELLVNYFSKGLVRLHLHHYQFVSKVSSCPVASPLARYMADHHGELERAHISEHEGMISMVNLEYYKPVSLPDILRCLLPYLDGSNDRDALRDILSGLIDEGVVTLPASSFMVTVNNGSDQNQLLYDSAVVVEKNLDGWLNILAKHALLVA